MEAVRGLDQDEIGVQGRKFGNAPAPTAEDWNELASLTNGLLETYLAGSKVTQCGKQLVWYNPQRNTLQKIQIEPRSFPKQCAAGLLATTPQ